MESHIGGPLILLKYVKTTSQYDKNDPDNKDGLIHQASEQFFAHIYMENSDQDKYGSISKNLNEKKLLGNDQYPKTVVEKNNVLSNHKFNNYKNCNERTSQRSSRNNSNNNETTKEKNEEESPKLSFA